jgi:hypothetical protein
VNVQTNKHVQVDLKVLKDTTTHPKYVLSFKCDIKLENIYNMSVNSSDEKE